MQVRTGVSRLVARSMVVFAITGGPGCGSFVTTQRNDDVLVRSEPSTKRTSEHVYRVQVDAEGTSPIRVRALRRSLCQSSERQVVDRTVVTTRTPGHPLELWMAGFGVAGMAIGTVGIVREVGGQHRAGPIALSALIGGFGTLLVGGYISQKVQSGDTREHVGEIQRTVDREPEPCGDETPVANVPVRLINDQDSGDDVVVQTNDKGEATIAEADVAKLFAPVRMTVDGLPAGTSGAAVERGRSARAVVMRRQAVEEEARERKRLAEEALLRQAALKQREHRAATFRKSVRVGDTSHCGLVIEIRPPVVKVQAVVGEVWLKVEQLYPAGAAPCVFAGSIYQEP